mgnify:CR=1 FL=1
MAPFLEHNCKSCSWPYIDFHNLIRLWDMDQWKVNKLSSCKIKIQMFWCSGIFRRFRTACNQEYLEVNTLHAITEDVFQIHLRDQEEEMQQIKLLPRFCFSSCLAFLSFSLVYTLFPSPLVVFLPLYLCICFSVCCCFWAFVLIKDKSPKRETRNLWKSFTESWKKHKFST